MDDSTIVWLIRHGSPDGMDGRCYGRYDAPLSAEGIQQAKVVAERLARESISHVYSSGLSRAVETARIIAEEHHLSVETIDDLAEIDFGEFEGLRYEDIERRYRDVFQSWMTRPTETEFPNGESFTQLSARAIRVMDLLISRHRKQSVVVVTHGGVLRVVLGKALSIPDEQIFRLAQGYGAVNRIRYFEHGPIVELING